MILILNQYDIIHLSQITILTLLDLSANHTPLNKKLTKLHKNINIFFSRSPKTFFITIYNIIQKFKCFQLLL